MVVADADCQASTGTGVFEQAFSERFYDVGIREQLLVQIGVGMSLVDERPVVLGTFMMFLGRAWEPLRQAAALKRLHLTIIGTHYGVTCGPDGKSHQCLEDLSMFRSLPNTTVYSPCSRKDVRVACEASLLRSSTGISIIRIPRVSVLEYNELEENPVEYTHQVLSVGSDLTIVTTGTMTSELLKIHGRLREAGIRTTHIHVLRVQPFPSEIAEILNTDAPIIVIEDHAKYGGLSTSLADLLMDRGISLRPGSFHRIGMETFGDTGEASELLKHFALDSESLFETIGKIITRDKRERS
jgi:transketolase